MSTDVEILTLCNGLLSENCYFFRLAGASQGVLIDPGADFGALDAAVSQSGASPALIIATHGHWDHVGQVAAFQKKYKVPLAMHPDDEALLEVLVDSYVFYGQGDTQVPVLDQPLADGQVVEVADTSLKIFHCPGHSPGGLCVYHADSGSLFSGDSLFKGSIGRSDLPGGSSQALKESIRQKLYTLPDDTRVYPGHGNPTTIGYEKANNPFVRV